jgi:triacylglycerol lipase
LAGWLRRIGYRPYLSGIDWNVGCPARKIELLDWRSEQIFRETNARLAVIGHSLGGVFARSIAINHPDHIRQIVMLGTPGRTEPWAGIRPEWRAAIRLVQGLGRGPRPASPHCGTPLCACDFMSSAKALPGKIRCASIYSRSDEVIDWRGCVDPLGENYEVLGGHLSLPVNSAVYRLLAAILGDSAAATEGSHVAACSSE